MSGVLQRFLKRGATGPRELDALLEKHAFPLVEGRTATFVYRGEADAVNLRHWVYGLPSAQPFERIAGTDLWCFALDLPEGSRVEYKIEVVIGDDRTWILDPLNPMRAHDPFGANSVCHGSGYEVPEWTRPDPEARRGEVHTTAVPSRAFDEVREVGVYVPARFRISRRYPVLLIHDGDDYLRYSGLVTVLDNLIHRLEIPPMVVALTNPGERLREYADDPAHARFLAEELLPHLEERFPILPGPAARGLLGASFGAVACLATAARYPGVFGRLLLQSGSFAFSDIGPHHRGPEFDPVVALTNRLRARPAKVSNRAFVSCGVYESLIYENRSLIPVLQRSGMKVRFVEARDGHNWENWRDRLREGLSWLFPGPLLMVYE